MPFPRWTNASHGGEMAQSGSLYYYEVGAAKRFLNDYRKGAQTMLEATL